MSAISQLQSRNNRKIIEGKYIDRVLREEANSIMKDQDRLISRHRLSNLFPDLYRRSYTVSSGRLTYRHSLRMRFIDMRKGKGVKKISVPVHNKVIYGHFNEIVNRLAYGLTQDVIDEIANEYQIHL